MPRKKIFIIGSYGAGNIGDEAILQVITEKFSEKNFEVIPAIPQLPYRFFSIPFRLKTFWNLWKSDLVLLGGGGLFTDSDSQKAIKIWGKNIFWAKLFGKKIFLFANSIGPFHQKKSQEWTKKYFEKIDYFSVRDEISLRELEKMGYKGEVFSDPVFSFKIPHYCHCEEGNDVAIQSNDTEKEKNNNLGKNNLNLDKDGNSSLDCLEFMPGTGTSLAMTERKIIAVSLRNLNNGKFNFTEFEKFLSEKEKNGYQILFIAMEDGDSILFEKNFHKKGRIIFKPKNFSELLEILSDVEFCIGMRLHFLIASAILGKKILAISYSQKVKGIMEKIGINILNLSLSFPTPIGNPGIEKFFKEPKKIFEEKEKFSELVNKVEKILK